MRQRDRKDLQSANNGKFSVVEISGYNFTVNSENWKSNN